MVRKDRLAYTLVRLGVGVCAATAGMISTSAPRVFAATRTLNADPASLGSVLQSARGGEHILLAAGSYGEVKFPHKTYNPALEIDARKAHFTHVMMQGVGGVAINGGIVNGPRSQTMAVNVDFSHDIQLQAMRTSGSQVGISVSRSKHVIVVNNVFDGMASDGVNIAGSQDIRVEGNVCRNFVPTRGRYDSKGKLLKDGNHPDCIQGWSIRGRPPLADISISGNNAYGLMQGIFFGNPGQGGIDKIVVRDNKLDLAMFNGIVVMDARGARVSHNIVRTIPGSRLFNYPFKQVTSWIKVTAGHGNVVCGNVVDVPRFSDDLGPCKLSKP